MSGSASHWNAVSRSRARWFFSFLVFTTIAFLVTQAFAQAPAFKSEKLDPALTAKAAVTQMEQARKEGVSVPSLDGWAKMAAFEAYYKRYIPGKMKDEAYAGELGAITQSLLDDLDRATKGKYPAAPLIHKYIIDIAKSISLANYHPAARINATLMLALINDSPEDPSTKKPPVPAASAFSPLVQLYMSPDAPDGVKAVALQGLARHVSLGAVKSPQARDGVLKIMRELVKSEAPAGRSASAHAFMQRYAVDILSVLASPNSSPETAQTLVALSTNASKPSIIAAYAAAKIAAIQPGKQKLDKLPSVLQIWAARAADTVDGEIARINHLEPPLAVQGQPAMPADDAAIAAGAARGPDGGGGYGGGSYGGGSGSPGTSNPSDMGMPGSPSGSSYPSEMGMGMGMGPMNGMMPVATANPQPLELVTSRRRINHLLQQLQLGVTGQPLPGPPTKPAGLVANSEPADKAAFDHWIETISDVVTAVNADTLDDRKKFLAELAIQSEVLRKLSGVEIDPVTKKPKIGAAVANQPAMNELDPLGGPAMNVAPAVPLPAAPVAAVVEGVAPAVAAPAAAPAAPAANAEVVDELQ